MIKYTAIVLVVMALMFTDGRLFRDCGENVGLGVRGKGAAVEPMCEAEMPTGDCSKLARGSCCADLLGGCAWINDDLATLFFRNFFFIIYAAIRCFLSKAIGAILWRE
jgi:hypothetical protein